jgi:hypothetical protein
MSWEREYHHMNLDAGMHKVGLIERGVHTESGQPARLELHFWMGTGAFEYHVGPNTVRIKLGGDFSIEPDGTLKDSAGNVFDPREFERHLLERLNHHHAALRAYARKHNVPEFKALPHARM